MNVQIANIHQAEKIYTLIEENEILHAVASKITEYDNLDSDDLDIEEVECVAQTLYDIASSGLMCGYSGFIYTNDLCNFYDEHREAISNAFEMADEFGLEPMETVYRGLAVADVVALNEKAKCNYTIFAIEFTCSIFVNDIYDIEVLE